jgi:DnaJ-class molecular chaperone
MEPEEENPTPWMPKHELDKFLPLFNALGLNSREATVELVKSKFKIYALENHPDKAEGDSTKEVTELMN